MKSRRDRESLITKIAIAAMAAGLGLRRRDASPQQGIRAAARRWGRRGQLPGLELLPAALGHLVRHRRERPYRDGHGTVSVAQSR